VILPSLSKHLLVITSALSLVRCAKISEELDKHTSYTTIVNRGRYYEVRIDKRQARHDGVSDFEIGREYGGKIMDLGLPVEALYDGFIAQTVGIMLDTGAIQDPAQVFEAVELLKPQIPTRYRDEVEGLASRFEGGVTDLPGDGLLSVNELYFLHLFQDIFRTQCSGVSVYGQRAERGQTTTAFLMDLFGRETLGRSYAVTTIVEGDQSLVLVGFLGLVNATVSFNDDGVFVGVPSSDIPGAYDAAGKRTVFFDVRRALEQYSTLEDVAAAMADSRQRYVFGFNLSLADPRGAAVLEVDEHEGRALRTAVSRLNPGVTAWPFGDAVATVNSFVLAGHTDNHTIDPVNFNRWNKIIEQLAVGEPTTSLDRLKQIATFENNDGPDEFLAGSGDIYNQWTLTITIFVPATRHLEMFFAPADGPQPLTPEFESIPVSF
jgi:hypothetical protein